MRRPVACVCAIMMVALLVAGLGVGLVDATNHKHCSSGNSAIREGTIHDVSIEDTVDVDGDGKVSSFHVDLEVDSRESRPRRQGKEAIKAVVKVIDFFSTGPGLPMGSGCIDLVPGYRVTLETNGGEIEFDDPFFPSYPRQYPDAGSDPDVENVYVGPMEPREDAPDAIPAKRSQSGNDVIVTEGPYGGGDGADQQLYTAIGRRTDDVTVTGVEVENCWVPMARGDAEMQGSPCISTENVPGDVFKIMVNSWIVEDDHRVEFDQPLEVEPPERDAVGEVTVTSDPASATVTTLFGLQEFGTTPWTGEIRADRPDVMRSGGPTLPGETPERYMRLRVAKRGYEDATTQVQVSPHSAESEVHVDLEKQELPITVTSEPSGMTVYLDGEPTGTTPWSQRLPWEGERYDIRVGHGPDAQVPIYRSQTLESVTPEAMIHVNLTERCFTGCFDGDLWTDYSATTPATDVDLVDVTDYSNTSGGYVTDLGAAGDPSAAGINLHGDLRDATRPAVDQMDDIDYVGAEATVAPTDPLTGEPVRFDANESYSLLDSIEQYTWSFGDGSTVSGETVTHSFDRPGSYTVELTVTDGNGDTATTQSIVDVRNRAPRAGFTVDALRTTTNATVSFDAGPSSDPDDGISDYAWRFGDGRTATGPTASHSYDSPGHYTVELMVTDPSGATAVASSDVSITRPNEPPTAEVDIEVLDDPGAYRFDAGGSQDPDGSIRKIVWRFGDGTNSTGDTVTHRYDGTGDRTVEATVYDDRGSFDTVNETVHASTGADAGTADGAAADSEADSDIDDDGGSAWDLPLAGIGTGVAVIVVVTVTATVLRRRLTG